MYDLAKGDGVVAVEEQDTGVSVTDSPAVESEADINLDRQNLIKKLLKVDLIPFSYGKSHRTTYRDDWVVVDFWTKGDKRYAKLHFFPKKPGTTKVGDLFKITISNGKLTEERIKNA